MRIEKLRMSPGPETGNVREATTLGVGVIWAIEVVVLGFAVAETGVGAVTVARTVGEALGAAVAVGEAEA